MAFTVEEIPHSNFRRIDKESGDIECTAQITLQDAICGYNMRIMALDSKPIDILSGTAKDPLTSSSFVRQFAEKGLPNSNNTQRGSLVVRFEVVFPEKLSDFQKKSLEKLLPN